MIFFKIFEDKWGNRNSCIEKLNDYLLEHPEYKVISYQLIESHNLIHSNLEARYLYKSDNLYPCTKILVQFEADIKPEKPIKNYFAR